MWAVWLLVGAALIAAEMLTLTFYLLWLGIGALAAAGVGFLVPGSSLYAQLLTAASAALLLTLLTKPLTRRLRRGRGYEDAIDRIVGREGLVVEPIEPGKPGIVKVAGETWSATADTPLTAGETVEVVKRGTAVLEVRKKGG
ncbi:NfeD family protein [Cohnella sp. CFH 77786]|uniref:NfeD family protein n=1 Tax=Cohnella sp. CFH 77786 TaxID=2662265 RepID=UPI002105952D|nr:NfeD family protein [Cohnella sp. CFH 77786]